MRDVAVIGVGITKFGERWNDSFRDIFVEAGLKAVQDAELAGDQIDEIFVGNMSGGRFVNQEHIASLIADHSGLVLEGHVPATRVEAACASGGLSVRQGVQAVASGYSDIVVVGGVEKMSDVQSDQSTEILAAAADAEWEGFYGATFPGLYAMMARRHSHEYGTTRGQMALCSVKNHYNATMNPNAQFQSEISVDAVLNSSTLAEPLNLLDASPITDGAAAVVLAPAEEAKKYSDAPVQIIGSGQASDTIALHDRHSLTTIEATKKAAERAYSQAGIEPEDADLAEVHDCFSIAEIMAIEDLGLFEKGRGGEAVEEGLTELNSQISVNPSGGLKACGHPVGATGVKQVAEATMQLRGDAGDRQVDGAEVGLTHNVGGTGGTAAVHVLERED